MVEQTEEHIEADVPESSLLSGLPGAVAAMVAGYLLWCIGDTIDVVVAFSESSLRMGATVVGSKPAWPWAAWIVGTIGLAGVAVRVVSGAGIDEHRLRVGGILLLFLSAARLLSLLDVFGYVFPWLGLIWSPAASWATAAFVAVWGHLCVRNASARAVSVRTAALAVFAFFLVIYTAYGLYFVKTTSLHGDEPQYLLITQSLLNDGDIDLSNADADRKLAFHAFEFDIHKAPASPEGRIHSTHPVGMPVLLTVPYAIGNWLWTHPRLGAVFSQTFLFAVACGLTVVLLARFGFSVTISTWTAVLTGLSVPLFTQSNQLYPEIHAVLITQIVLIVFSRWPSLEAGSLSTRTLALLCGCIVILPFFHQRHLILAAVLAVPVLLLIRREGAGGQRVRVALAVFGVGALAHLAYNLHYSGDIWGPYLPGNADTLSFDWGQSVFGQWIDVRQGLFRQSPVYLLAVLGVICLVRARDRRVYLIAALLVATAGVNTLSSDWTFGFCYPTRFMVAAYPALALALAFGLQAIASGCRPLAIWLTCVGWWLGWEGVVQGAVLPEIGFEGLHLVSRLSEPFYPAYVHFQDFVAGETLIGGVAVFWLLVVGGLYLATGHTRMRRAAICSLALAPLLLSRTIPYQDVLASSFTYQIRRFQDDSAQWYRSGVDLEIPMRPRGRGTYASSLPPMFRGKVEITPRIKTMTRTQGVVGFHTLALTSFGMRHGGSRHTVPLINSSEQAAHTFITPGSAIAQQYVYSVGRPVTAEDTKWVLEAEDERRETVYAEPLPQVGDGNPVSMTLDGFKAGHYALYLERRGASWADFFSREPGDNVVAVFTGFERIRTDAEGLAKMASRWLAEGWRDVNKPLPETYFPPQVEARVPYFWSLLPSEWDQSGVSFTITQEGPIHIVLIPDRRVEVEGIRIERIRP